MNALAHDISSLPTAPAVGTAPPVAREEADATIAALKPPKRQRPLIAIVGINESTETTDYLMPYGILRRADVADVVTLATQPGPVSLFPVLKVEPDATTDAFDAEHPDGADYVIVPAMSRDELRVAAALRLTEAPPRAFADGRLAREARATRAATEPQQIRNPIARGKIRHALSDPHDFTGELVPEDYR